MNARGWAITQKVCLECEGAGLHEGAGLECEGRGYTKYSPYKKQSSNSSNPECAEHFVEIICGIRKKDDGSDKSLYHKE